uniref:LRRCT domain-containing protein n=1 Tax=Heliothis virescens TaxID=7102 RepID=A0A2A4JFS5_HELVI
MTSAVLTSCHCPEALIHGIGQCSFRLHCTGDIRGVHLPIECTEATNFPVNVDVTITDAEDRVDENTDLDFLSTITTLKLSGQWQLTKLAMLTYTTKLQNLILVNNCIETISGNPFYYLNSLITLNLSHNRLTDISELFEFESHPNKLRVLSLAYNAIDVLPGDAFGELSSLVELDLSFNVISDLSEEPFYNLTKLEKLRLNNNRIKDLNGAVNSLQNLKHLYLRGNHIQHINEESLMIIRHLETFDISYNQLEQIEPIMFTRHWNHFGNHSFCKIILTGNHITNVPNATSNEIFSRFARNLEKNIINIATELDLSVNGISNIEYNAFQSLMQLVTLNLSRNKLIDFRVDAKDLADIKCLNLSNNYISHLYYESFAYMTNLQNLDLSYNRLNFIPDMTFNNNYNLKYVNMTFNEIAKLDNIYITMFHPEGGNLDLSNNGLFKLHIPHGEGIRLEKLMLHSNNISDPTLIDLSHQTELKQLDMSDNLIEDLNANSLLLPESTLVYLDLTCNKIQSIGPATFKKVPHLKTLRLGHNQLTKLEYGAFQGLTDLSNLDLSYNRITYLDSKYLLDLKYLHVLSLRSNDMYYLEMNSWYGHKVDLTVFVDNNNLTCDWLGRALKDYNNGYTRVRPTVLVGGKGKNTLEGIPCISDESEKLTGASQSVLADERLLVTSQKILEAVREQNYYFRKFILRAIEGLDEKQRKDK